MIMTDPPCCTVTGVGGPVTVYEVSTVSILAEDVEPANPAFPEYTTVMLSAPVARLPLVKVATPEELTVTLREA